jgi:hypothetical protein
LLASILSACGAPAPAPTAIPASISIPTDASAIAQAFWDAINSRNIDAAMAYVADDVETSGGAVRFSSKSEFSDYMLWDSNRGTALEITDLKMLSADTVTYTMKVYSNYSSQLARSSDLELRVRDGKIVRIQFAN